MKKQALTFLLVPFFILGAAGCPADEEAAGLETAAGAVVAWLEAIDRGDFEAAARLAPPGEEIDAAQLSERFSGARRDADAPFTMSEPEEGRAVAMARLRRPEGPMSVNLLLEEREGRWYVLPQEEGASPKIEARPPPEPGETTDETLDEEPPEAEASGE